MRQCSCKIQYKINKCTLFYCYHRVVFIESKQMGYIIVLLFAATWVWYFKTEYWNEDVFIWALRNGWEWYAFTGWGQEIQADGMLCMQTKELCVWVVTSMHATHNSSMHGCVCVRCAKARFKLVLSVGHPTRQNSQCGRAVSCMNYV